MSETNTDRTGVEETPMKRITADEEYTLEVNGFRCPDEFVTFFTPLEFEELVTMFLDYDANGSGTIDIYEIRKILHHMDMDMSKENAQELMDLIDIDGSGEIDFEEYCGFIALTKQGDEKFTKFNKLLDKMGDTPLGMLEQQAKARHFQTRFFLVEEREATATTPPLVVVELLIEGIWHSRENGVTTSRFEVKRFQGMGPNSKQAKDAATKLALVKLRNYMPGATVPEGEFPDEWLKWVNDNICRGVPPLEIIDVLVQKGFKPTKNTPLMHKLIASILFDQFQTKYPDFDPDDMSRPTIDMRFSNWIKRVGDTGIDGKILLDTLEDRGMEISKHQPYIADKMRYNEFSSLMEKDGKAPKFLDFWQCCADGFDVAVELYIRGDMELDAEKMGRFGSIARTALMLAAMGNHPKTVKLLIEGKANVSLADRRGRTALHYAALHGAVECCDLLMNAGAALFQGDHQGNTALHLATWQNHPASVDFLCYKGQEFTRSITADKVAVRRGTTFNELAQELFSEMQDKKLRPIETRRFQKIWIHETACLFREKMDPKVRHMLAPTCVEIMEDVLHRFDPRPETGIFVSTAVEGEQLFIPTIPSPMELAVLLRYMFRQSALDCTNNWNRTALHLAADENCVSSHRETITVLVDKHGCNVMLKDMHGRTPYDLLVMDKTAPKNPTATSVREYLLFENRVEKITELTDIFDKEDRVVLEKRRQEVLDDCIRRGFHMNQDLWEATRMASLLIRTHDKKWNYYVDPDTKNGFYCLQPLDASMGDPFTDFTFEIPDAVRATVHRDIAWEYHRQSKSEIVRTVGDWVTMKCCKTGCTYYYNVETKEYTFDQPECYDWKLLAKDAKYVESYGYSEEWQEFVIGMNFFYFEKNIKTYRWTKPTEAVTVTPSEKFCSGYKKKNRRIDQKWYTCDQCNKELKALNDDGSDKLVMIKLCEPCINRCHRGHKGTRLVRISPISCQCSSLCHEFCPCKALEISKYQLNVMQEASDKRQEERRVRMHEALMPPIFALCPQRDRHGNLKRESGYTMCRRRPPVNMEDLGTKVHEFENSTVMSDDNTSASLAEASSSFLDDDEYSVVGSLYDGDSGRISRSFLQLAENNFDLLVREDFKEYANRGWVEVLDPEVQDEVEIGARVLCVRQGVVPRCYGTVIQKMRRGVYKVQFTVENDTEDISTEKLEVLSKPVFYFNRLSGLSTWELPPLYDENGVDVEPQLPPSESLQISGNDWLALKLVATERRTFNNYEEFEDPYSGIIFYVHMDTYIQESAALKLQGLYRHKHRKARPRNWTATCFTFTKPKEVFDEERIKAGWALLRRRASCLGEFMDVDYYEWEELMDQESADFFYWQEDMDSYSWDKPPVPKTVYATKIKPLEIGEKVYHKFPGKEGEEIGTVMRVRKDDETNEDMYDIQHDKQDLYVKWVPRYRIKKLAKSGEELILALSAAQWKKQIRRQREKEKRIRALARQKRMEEEKAKRGKTVVSKSSGTASMSIASSADELQRARILRSRAEKLQLQEERNAEMLAKRAVAFAALMKEMEEMNKKLSKSELISLQRSISLKLEVEALMEKRTKSQNVLVAKRVQAKERARILENSLRTQEDLMTTPRSSIRRRLLRLMHFAILRQLRGQVICEWGCGDWVKLGQEQQDHQLNFCSKRIVSCALGCSKRLTEDEWLSPYVPDRDIEAEENQLAFAEDMPVGDPNAPPPPPITYQEHHETAGCPKRLQPCPRQCLEWVTAEELEFHMNELCVKRDAKPLECRQGCGMMFGGIVETMIQAEDERFDHEQEECPFRQVRCNWRNQDGSLCAAQMCATERDAHRDSHIERLGVSTYVVPGTYVYKVHAQCTKLKIQMWGAGGGSGQFKERRGGSGGGGAFVEILINVNPYDVLEIVVGRGGQAGVYGTELEAVHHTAREGAADGEEGSGKIINTFDVIDASYGVALGGVPGGGDGYGGGGKWAAGGGGGYTIVSKRTRDGSQVIAVAAGGGGGGSQDGVPGVGMEGPYPGARVDMRNGGCAIGEKGGVAGDSGNVHNADFAATPGEAWQGGNGSQYGGGGGGGYAGGGGGGTSPGIGGGGGGGSSFIYLPMCRDYMIIHGDGKMPGGLDHDPLDGVGIGEWDKVGGFCGEGGTGHPTKISPGNGGAVRILKPGFFKD